MLSLLLLVDASAQTVTTSGACTGPVLLTATNLRKNGEYALLVSDRFGSSAVAGGRCAGVRSDLARPSREWVKRAHKGELYAHYHADEEEGEDGCLAHFQLVELKTCEVSNPVRVPPLGWEKPAAKDEAGGASERAGGADRRR